jgi:hypothetical protein
VCVIPYNSKILSLINGCVALPTKTVETIVMKDVDFDIAKSHVLHRLSLEKEPPSLTSIIHTLGGRWTDLNTLVQKAVTTSQTPEQYDEALRASLDDMIVRYILYISYNFLFPHILNDSLEFIVVKQKSAKEVYSKTLQGLVEQEADASGVPSNSGL